MQELETLGGSWSKLEQELAKRNSEPPEDQYQRLNSEKSKLEQKVSLLQKQSTAFNNTYKAQKSQFEKQLEQIRKLEELERNLRLQLVYFG
jgi:predicted  nucleic acid-binding Zn-ribbon protein